MVWEIDACSRKMALRLTIVCSAVTTAFMAHPPPVPRVQLPQQCQHAVATRTTTLKAASMSRPVDPQMPDLDSDLDATLPQVMSIRGAGIRRQAPVRQSLLGFSDHAHCIG